MQLRPTLFLATSLLALTTALPVSARQLNVKIEDIPATGDIHVFVYTSDKDFPKESAAIVHTQYPVTDQGLKEMTVHIEAPDAEQYALVAYQDKDGNGKMNRLLGMIPQEPYGLSKNPSLFGKPKFSEAAVTPADDQLIVIRLKD